MAAIFPLTFAVFVCDDTCPRLALVWLKGLAPRPPWYWLRGDRLLVLLMLWLCLTERGTVCDIWCKPSSVFSRLTAL